MKVWSLLCALINSDTARNTHLYRERRSVAACKNIIGRGSVDHDKQKKNQSSSYFNGKVYLCVISQVNHFALVLQFY